MERFLFKKVQTSFAEKNFPAESCEDSDFVVSLQPKQLFPIMPTFTSTDAAFGAARPSSRRGIVCNSLIFTPPHGLRGGLA